jgi:hypothetical protein
MPTDWKTILAQAPARSLRSLLADLAQLRQHESADQLPVVSLYLAGGKVLTGTVVAFESGHMQSIVVLHASESPDPFKVRHQMMYVDLAHVSAISLDDAGRSDAAERVVTGRKAASPPAETAAMSRLDFQRYLLETTEAMAQVLHTGFAFDAESSLLESTDDFSGFQLQVANLTQALASLNRDAWGREALLSKVQRVRLQKAAQFTLRLDEHTLVVGLHPQTAPTPDQLKSTLEALL